jgi:hypothetical protein
MRRFAIVLQCVLVALAAATAAGAKVRITKIYYNSPGKDNGSNDSLNSEWVMIKNISTRKKKIQLEDPRRTGPRLQVRWHHHAARQPLADPHRERARLVPAAWEARKASLGDGELCLEQRQGHGHVEKRAWESRRPLSLQQSNRELQAVLTRTMRAKCHRPSTKAAG